MGTKSPRVLRCRALWARQTDDYPLYLFFLTPAELLEVADVSRISRSDAGKLIGYQRPEVRRHVREIAEYLDGDDFAVLPSAIILALSSRVTFTRSRGPHVEDGRCVAGTLAIPRPRGRGPKPAWIVDGQQRALALSKCRRQDLPVVVSGFVADSVDLQRDQFLRVNNTRPLPRGLITELLPEVSTNLPPRLAARKIPSAVCDWLNQHAESPFHGLIRRASSAGSPARVVTDTAVVKMIGDSLHSPSGCLFPYRNIATGETDLDGICGVLVAYWKAVRNVFPDAWGKPPSRSRLMHGAGIVSVGRLMDRVMAGINPLTPKAVEQAERELRKVAPVCRWTGGVWEGLNDLPWNAVENTARHISALSNLLVRAYLQGPGGGG
jgi:DGQHR domain-containing protein